MNQFNLQRDFLRDLININLKDKGGRVLYDYDEEKEIYYLSDGYRFYIIDKDEMFLDLSKAKHFNMKNMYEEKDLKDLKHTGIVEELDKTKVRLFEGDDFNVWVNDSFLKYLDKKLTVYKGINPMEPVFCYEIQPEDDEKLVAVLLPIRRGND